MRKLLVSLLFFPFVAVALVACLPLWVLCMVFPEEADVDVYPEPLGACPAAYLVPDINLHREIPGDC